jgi:drug/metabolite transporter (DMT)-like permease
VKRWAGIGLIVAGVALVSLGTPPRTHVSRRRPVKWIYIAIIVAATTVGEVMQAAGMRRHGEIRDFRPGAIGRAAAALLSRNAFVIGSVVAMAVSFFAYLGLLTIAELSFAVPVTAVTYVLETVLAKYILKEHVNWLRWAGASLVICGVALVSL